MTEEEIEFGEALSCCERGKEQNLRFTGSEEDAWRNGPLQWPRNGTKLEARRKRGGTPSLGVAAAPFYFVSAQVDNVCGIEVKRYALQNTPESKWYKRV